MIFDIQHASVVDGPGMRTTVFFKGCNLQCPWCHNPEGQSFEQQVMFYKDKCVGCGRCHSVDRNDKKFICYHDAREICGKEYTVDELFENIVGDKVFYENSGGGVTFSGGECMLQLRCLCKILKKSKESNIHTAVDTAGAVPWASFEQILPYTDMFLYDVKSMDTQRHRQYTGVENEQILENLSRLLQMRKRVWVRVPVIPGINDTVEEMHLLRDFLQKYGYPEKVELLPYHGMGESKWEALGRKAAHFSQPSTDQMDTLRDAVKSRNPTSYF